MNRLKNLLVVEDDEYVLGMYLAVLKQGLPLATVYSARTLEEAEVSIQSQSLDGIYLDLKLAHRKTNVKTEGTEAIAYLVHFCKSRSLSLPPIVAMSGDDNLAIPAIEAGAHSFIGKGWTKWTQSQLLLNAMKEAVVRETSRPYVASEKKLIVDEKFQNLAAACDEKERQAQQCVSCPPVKVDTDSQREIFIGDLEKELEIRESTK